ncbi:MAG: hypothetical protein WAT91_18625 [Saprospiraceae bacterium]
MNIVSSKFAINAMLIILCLVIVFHLFVLAQLIPYTIVWGGRFQNATQMMKFEAISVVMNALMIFVMIIKGRYINLGIPIKLTNSIIWLMVVLFVLNTIGNLLSKASTETIIFTPITFVSALLCFRIVMDGK